MTISRVLFAVAPSSAPRLSRSAFCLSVFLTMLCSLTIFVSLFVYSDPTKALLGSGQLILQFGGNPP